jgi:hypothetical protein
LRLAKGAIETTCLVFEQLTVSQPNAEIFPPVASFLATFALEKQSQSWRLVAQLLTLLVL